MTNPIIPPDRPPHSPQPPPQTLNYSRPPAPRNNVWWKVGLRILAGLVCGIGCAALCAEIMSSEKFSSFWIVPPLVILSVLIFVAIKYRRFGYVTGFLLAPFVIGATLFVILLIMCGSMLKH